MVKLILNWLRQNVLCHIVSTKFHQVVYEHLTAFRHVRNCSKLDIGPGIHSFGIYLSGIFYRLKGSAIGQRSPSVSVVLINSQNYVCIIASDHVPYTTQLVEKLSWVPVVSGKSWPGYELSRVLLYNSLPWYKSSWVHVISVRSCLGYKLCIIWKIYEKIIFIFCLTIYKYMPGVMSWQCNKYKVHDEHTYRRLL